MQKSNIFKNLAFYKKQAILGPLFKLLEASFELFVPLVVSDIIDNGIANNDFKYILSRFAILFLLALIGLVCSVTAQYFSAKAAVGFATKTRQDLFNKIEALDFSSLDTIGASSLINKMTSNINQVQTGVNLVLRLFLRSPFVVFGAMIMAFTISVKIAWIFTLMILILSLIVFGIMLISIPLNKNVQEKSDKILSLTRENLIGTRVLRAFNKQEDEKQTFKTHNDLLSKSQKFVGNISGALNPLTFVCVNMFIVWLIYLGAIQVNLGNISQGNVIALYNYMTQILVELVKLANLIIQITKSFASKHRIESVLNHQNTLIQNNNLNNFEQKEYEPLISFKNVSVKYPNNQETSLSNISFDVFSGQTIGIIGGTGSGKSTLVNLIPHFYDTQEGDIFYKGENLKNIDTTYLRNKIGMVMQKNALFEGTIKDNLLIGNPIASDEDLVNALKTSQSYDFVFSKDENLLFNLKQGGANLSGGQKQRLCIARALVKKPEILILDDSFSALDYKTDLLLRTALKNLPYNLTQIIVTQRTSSILNADQIIVLDDGKMVGLGTHEFLLNNCEVYKEIHYSQYKGVKDEK